MRNILVGRTGGRGERDCLERILVKELCFWRDGDCVWARQGNEKRINRGCVVKDGGLKEDNTCSRGVWWTVWRIRWERFSRD